VNIDNKCQLESASTAVDNTAIVVQSLTGLAALLVIGCSFVNPSAISSLWSVIGQLQILMLLILAGSYIPVNVVDYISASNFASFSLIFMNIQNIDGAKSLIDELDYPQSSTLLKKIGLESGSTFVNVFCLIGFFCIIIVLHLIFVFVCI
jgi:hypothetical protein